MIQAIITQYGHTSALKTRWKNGVNHRFPWYPEELQERLNRSGHRTLVNLNSGHTEEYDRALEHRPMPLMRILQLAVCSGPSVELPSIQSTILRLTGGNDKLSPKAGQSKPQAEAYGIGTKEKNGPTAENVDCRSDRQLFCQKKRTMGSFLCTRYFVGISKECRECISRVERCAPGMVFAAYLPRP